MQATRPAARLLDEEARGAGTWAPPATRPCAPTCAWSPSLAATRPGPAPALEGFARDLPGLLAAREDRVDEEMRRVGEAHAFEAGSSSARAGRRSGHARAARPAGAGGRVDPVFLAALDEAGPPPPRRPPRCWSGWPITRTQLADTIFAMDRGAKQAEIDRGGPDAIASPEVVNRIGQAATVQAHARFLVEGLAARL